MHGRSPRWRSHGQRLRAALDLRAAAERHDRYRAALRYDDAVRRGGRQDRRLADVVEASRARVARGRGSCAAARPVLLGDVDREHVRIGGLPLVGGRAGEDGACAIARGYAPRAGLARPHRRGFVCAADRERGGLRGERGRGLAGRAGRVMPCAEAARVPRGAARLLRLFSGGWRRRGHGAVQRLCSALHGLGPEDRVGALGEGERTCRTTLRSAWSDQRDPDGAARAFEAGIGDRLAQRLGDQRGREERERDSRMDEREEVLPERRRRSGVPARSARASARRKRGTTTNGPSASRPSAVRCERARARPARPSVAHVAALVKADSGSCAGSVRWGVA